MKHDINIVANNFRLNKKMFKQFIKQTLIETMTSPTHNIYGIVKETLSDDTEFITVPTSATKELVDNFKQSLEEFEPWKEDFEFTYPAEFASFNDEILYEIFTL